jgi:phosphatidate cytidylyltransferase
MLLPRILTALVLIPLVLAAILLPPTWLFASIVAVVFLAAHWEWSRLSLLRGEAARLAWLVLTAMAMTALWRLHDHRGIWVAGIAIGVLWWLLSLFWLRHYSFGASPTRENSLLKLLAGLLVFIPTWLSLIELHGYHNSHGQLSGRWWTLLVIVVVWSADTGAYFSGRFFGKRKLAPRISPGKTWAGVYGALVLGAIVCAGGGYLLGVHGTWGLLGMFVLGLATVAASVIGDLLESLLKRQANIKDSGRLFPGHGGLLDRMDSLFAALPVFVIGRILLGL